MLLQSLCAILALSSLETVYGGPLALRAGGPIWGPSGAPAVNDLKQTTTPDCGFMSVLGAIVHVNPNWLKSKVTVEGSPGSATSVSIQMYDHETRAPKIIKVTKDEQEAWNGNRNDVWWPGAFEHGGVKVGLPARDGRLGPVLPSHSMQSLTGLEADGKMNPTADQIFDFALKAAAQNTPMVWQTPGSGSRVLVGGHAYGFFGGKGSGADRMVTLFNPWGDVKDYKLSDVAGDCYMVWFFSNYDTFTGGGGGGGGGDPPPTPTTRPPPVINAVEANTWRETNRVTETRGNLVVIKEMVTVHVGG